MDGGSLPNRSEVHYAEGQFVEGVTASCETALETLPGEQVRAHDCDCDSW